MLLTTREIYETIKDGDYEYIVLPVDQSGKVICPFCSALTRRRIYHLHGICDKRKDPGTRGVHCLRRDIELLMSNGKIVNNKSDYFLKLDRAER